MGRILIIFAITFATSFHFSYACQMEGVTIWLLPQSESILDTFRGNVVNRSTSSIEGISSISYGEGMNSGPYLELSHSDSRFLMWTNNAYENYEEYETEESMSVTVTFRCTGGTTNTLVFLVNVIDTNNNAPQFRPNNEFEFTVAPPLPPRFLVTGCLNDITVRDIDLTTQRIEFEIEENPYFEIEYDVTGSTVAKEFKAQLRTLTFIRSLPEPITLRIRATDVDLTGDPPFTSNATIRITGDTEFEFPEEPVFNQTFYLANYTDDHQLVLYEPLSLQRGFDEFVTFSLEGEYSNHFELDVNGNQVLFRVLTPLPATVLTEKQIFLVVRADREYTSGDTTTVIIRLPEEIVLKFESLHYTGSIVNNSLQLSPLVLNQGYEGGNVSAAVINEYSSYFTALVEDNLVTLTITSLSDNIIEENNFISLQVTASTDRSSATVIVSLEIIKDDKSTPIFDKPIYRGSYNPVTGLTVEQIVFVQGFDESVAVYLHGEHASYFNIVQDGVIVTLTSLTIPPEIYSQQNILLSIEATKPRTVGATAAVVIALPEDTQAGSDVSFEKILYEGIIQSSVVYHENIVVSNFTGANIEIEGEYARLFVAYVSNGVVTVVTAGAFVLPADVTHIVLELSTASARAVLLLNVNQSDNQILPVVTFISQSYALRVEITQTGLVGQVHATADNREELRYSLLSNNTHLLERLSINNEGELHLSAPVNTGVYTFQVAATTVFSQVTGTATVHLSVEAITVCGDDFVVPPLIILDRDEEEPHYDLINGTQYDGCRFSLTNRWPLDQTWLYVDETGLHARSIDREHESIAFMALSQVQVELILHCDSDDPTRSKRSLNSERLDWLGPYDYGTSKWILADTILYNSRRSLVNLIVNDINDNAPIFVGKELEPIVVGYPVPNLESTVLPRSLAELQATDADIGENAALLYWSTEPELAVAPYSGFVHVRDGATLDNNTLFRINATDQNGEGLTGSIDIEVRLLDENNIAVLTVREAFLDDEKTILNYLRSAIGYEVRALRSVVISHDEDVISRRKRERNGAGASLQLFIYGLVEREPVSVDKLTTDISNNVIAAVNIASTVSLGDHLEAQEICVIPGRDTGLLAATIVLSILLFIALVLIAVWFFLRWRKNRNYQQFSDANSLASRNESLDQFPKAEVVTKPRLNLEDLKKSERRLQEMLDNPIDNAPAEPTSSRNVPPLDAILDMAPPAPHAPIVIQSIDKLKDAADDSDEDEFGEISTPRRKSVVTFNENVEKIIHVEDADEDINTYPEYEIYKL